MQKITIVRLEAGDEQSASPDLVRIQMPDLYSASEFSKLEAVSYEIADRLKF